MTAAVRRLAVVYDARSITPMVMAQAAEGVCSLLWVVDLADPELRPLSRMFQRLGTVVDIAGLDEDEIVERVAAHQPDGILTLAESRMELTARIAAALGLVYHSAEAAGRLADKLRQRGALRAAGLPTPAAWEVPAGGLEGDARDPKLETLAAQLPYPVVVKPRQGTGSRSTVLVDSPEQLVTLVSEPGAEGESFLVEEHLADGGGAGRFADDLAVESVVRQGRFLHLCTTGKFRLAPPFRGQGSFLPGDLDAATHQAVLDAAEAAIRAVGITDGFVNTDVKLTPEGPRVVEVNGRLGGNVPELVELAGGPPLLAQAYRLALGDDILADPELAGLPARHWDRVGYYAWVQPPLEATRLVSIAGLDDVGALDHVRSVVLNRRPGDDLAWREGGRGFVCAVYGVVSSHDELVSARAEIDRCLVIEYATAAG